MVCYNPLITGYYNALYTLNNQDFYHCFKCPNHQSTKPGKHQNLAESTSFTLPDVLFMGALGATLESQSCGLTKTIYIYYMLVGAQPPPYCSFACHLVGRMAIDFSFAHH